MPEMISLEEAQELLLSNVKLLPTETVSTLEAVGRVSSAALKSDINLSPFADSAMDGYVLYAEDIAEATIQRPIVLDVIAEIPAGSYYDGSVEHGQCLRIMTGAPIPGDLDAVVKYEIVEVLEKEGKAGGKVSFSAPTNKRSSIREAGEEAKAGETVVNAGDVITNAGVGFLASCGILEATTYQRPRVAIIAIGSELVAPQEIPSAGKIRNSNSYALAACVQAAGGIPSLLPIVKDDRDLLSTVVLKAAQEYDFVITSGGASNGDFDFIKAIVENLGKLLMTSVNIRPGKAQTFGIVEETPIFGLPGNPAAAYVGFEMLIRPALRKMQGYTHLARPKIKAELSSDVKKKDPRRIFLRSTLYKNSEGEYVVAPAKNQSSALFGPIQRSNCLAILPEGTESRTAGALVECILLDVSEELSL